MTFAIVRHGIGATFGAVRRGLVLRTHCAPTIDGESGNTDSGSHEIFAARHRAIHRVPAVRAPRSEEKAAGHGVRVPDDSGRRIPHIVPALIAEAVRVGADFEARGIGAIGGPDLVPADLFVARAARVDIRVAEGVGVSIRR